jgi:hypothetical protein
MNDHSPEALTLRERIEALGEWFLNIDLGGNSTAPNHFVGDYPRCKWEGFAKALPADLSGRTVLDIGCTGSRPDSRTCRAGPPVFQSMLRGSADVACFESDYPFAETGIFTRRDLPVMYFIEKSYPGDATNWWIPNRACAEAILRTAGFEIILHPEIEVFICRRRDGLSAGQPKPHLTDLCL